MAITELKDWFQGLGSPVTGERLVGNTRQKLAVEIYNSFFESDTGSNMMMNGLPRIGKTSILMEARRLYESDGLSPANKIVCFIDMIEYQSFTPQEVYFDIINSVFKAIPRNIVGNLKNSDLDLEYYVNWFSERMDKSIPLVRAKGQFEDFFKDCKEAKLSIRIVFDEFDSILSVFKNEEGKIDERGLMGFQGALRKIITINDYDVKAFFISRNLLEEIEPENTDSTISGVCGSPITLKLFDNQEISDFWATLAVYDKDHIIDDPFKSTVMKYSQGYPYLMNLVANDLVVGHSAQIVDTIVRQYNSIVKMLNVKINLKGIEDTSLKDTLLQLMVGPQHNISLYQVQRLARYDIIRQKEDQSYEVFCPFFLDYLENLAMHVPVWEVLGTFERKMREIIANFLESIGDSENDIQSNVISDDFRRTLNGRRATDKKIGKASSDSLLDYLYTSEYIRFVEKGWEGGFDKVFTNYTLDQCKSIFSTIASTRNSNMHYRPIASQEKLMIVRYINNIVDRIDKYLQKRP